MPHSNSIYSNNAYSMRSAQNIDNLDHVNMVGTLRIDTPSSLEPPSYNAVMGKSKKNLKSTSQPYFTQNFQIIQNSATI